MVEPLSFDFRVFTVKLSSIGIQRIITIQSMFYAYFRDHNLCMVSTRRSLLSEAKDTTLMQRKYGRVCNVIVDEAQNFKDWDGDWYSLAEKLANQHAPDHSQRCCHYFWVFMDYSQKVHKFQAGLPSVIGKNNFMLSEVSRNTKEIFEFTSRLMMASDKVEGLCNPYLRQSSIPRLAHNYSAGKSVDIVSCQETEIQNMLSKVLSSLLKNGVRENDIAILVGRRSELQKLKPSLSDLSVDKKSDHKDEVLRSDSGAQLLTFPQGHTLTDETAICTVHEKHTENYAENENSAISESDSVEITNQFDVLSSSSSHDGLDNATEDPNNATKITIDGKQAEGGNQLLGLETDKESMFYGHDYGSEQNETALLKADEDIEEKKDKEETVSVDTVRGFSGLDKAAVIGINPEVNEDHADFNRFILSLASRARDNLVIITTSDSVKEQLDKYIP